MKGNAASADTALLALWFTGLLANFHLKLDVELAARTHFFFEVFDVDNVIDRWSEAGSQEAVVHLLANDDVIRATFAKEVHASGYFGVAEECSTSHGVVPVAIESTEGEDSGERVLVEASEADAGSEGIRKPDQGAHLVPESIPGTEPTKEILHPTPKPAPFLRRRCHWIGGALFIPIWGHFWGLQPVMVRPTIL